MRQMTRAACRIDEKLSACSEDYLKAVYHISRKTVSVRSSDIADLLGVTRPSVHRGMEVLQEAGLVNKPLYGEVTLTERGRRQAQVIVCKYNLLKRLLISLQVDEETAAQDACRMEHSISDETMFHLMRYYRKNRPCESKPVCPACWNENAVSIAF